VFLTNNIAVKHPAVCNLLQPDESNPQTLKHQLMKTSRLCLVVACNVLFAFQGLGQENPKLSDAEVASVAVAANQIDIAYAQIAKEKSKNAEVLKFAETMTNDHNAVLKQAGDLVTKLGVTPKENAVSKQLLSDAEKKKGELRTKSEKDFNKAYIDNEVAYHKAVISAVEGLLIPETENAELKSLLQNIVPALKTHLAHAEMVQKMIK
jgi:putative membrane protein